MKKFFLIKFFFFFLFYLGVNNVFADSPNQLIVVRSPNDELFKMVCYNTPSSVNCSSWEMIPGLFSSQPTLVWDNDIGKYILWGVNSSGQIWSSTFDPDGTFNNDWVLLSGSSPSPVAAASAPSAANNTGYSHTENDTTLTATDQLILSTTVKCPYDGVVVARASGNVYFTGSGTGSARLYLSDGTNTYYQWSQHEAVTDDMFTIEAIFTCPSATNPNPRSVSVSFGGLKSGSANASVINPSLVINYYSD